MQPFQSNWLMMSDVCKHCERAGCLEACPTGALFQTEFGTVVVQQDICNGCGYCVPACPFGVVELDRRRQGAQVHAVLRPPEGWARAGVRQVVPDELDPVRSARRAPATRAVQRVEDLHRRAPTTAYLYGVDGVARHHGRHRRPARLFLLTDRPEVYNLPSAPTLPSTRVRPA